ncbi:MAG TPA: S-adenosylmethionine:tRNA ribosyltransferase-isomerase [Casimicrobiaceae bacterium]|nr:S-adenosylmethionine:tRNA ribosyltransferase-isomerase [Casimicrobiaceae bacterium]
MIAAHEPIQRPPDAKLLVIDATGRITHWPRRAFPALLSRGDLVVANDAATLPASLRGVHVASGRNIEVRLAQRGSLDPEDVRHFAALIFGEGDYRTPTEDRPLPPVLAAGDVLALGPLRATVRHLCGHPRFVALRFDGTAQAIWRGLALHGRAIQYAYMRPALELWDVWTPFAGAPAAFEAPSAGFALDWALLAKMRRRGVEFATITHAAGISSTGDEALDALLPLDEPYRIPSSTAHAVARARERHGRIIAVGTTVVRALEAAAAPRGLVHAGAGIAATRIVPATQLRVVDAVLSGTHEPGTSHYALLGAFVSAATLREADRELETHRYRTHEFGDSVLVERAALPIRPRPAQRHAA